MGPVSEEVIHRQIIQIVGDSSGLTAAYAKAGRDSNTFGSKIKKIGSNIASLAGPAIIGGVLAVGAGFAKATMDAAGFEKQMAEVFTLIPEASEQARDQMTAHAREVAKEIGVIPSEVAPALYQAISAGVPADNVFSFIEAANKAAVGGVTDLTTAVDGLTSVVNAYGAEVLDVTEASDIMFTAVKLGKTDFGELAGFLYQVIPTAASLGVSFEEVGAGLAAITAQGTPTRVASTQLRQMFVELSKESSETAKTFSNLAGESFKDFVAGGGTVEGALKIMGDYAASTDQSISDLFSSVEAGNAALQLTGEGAEKFAVNLAEMENAAGATDKAFETMEGTLSRQLDKIHAQLSTKATELGEKFLPTLKDVIVPLLTDYVVPAIGAVGDGLTLLFTTIGSWWNGEGQGVFSGVTTAWNGIVQVLRPGIEALIEFIQGEVQMVSDWWDENGALIAEAVGVVMGAIQAAITPVLNAIVALFEWAWPYVSQIMENNLAIVLDLVTMFCQIITGDWDGAWQTVQDITERAVNSIQTIGAAGFNALASGIEYVMNGISDFMAGVWKAIVQTVEDSINSLIDIINGFIESVNEVTGQVGITLPTLPKLELEVEAIKAPHLEIPKIEIPVAVNPETSPATGGTPALTPVEVSHGDGVHIEQFNVYSPKADPATMAHESRRALRDLASRGSLL